MRYLICIETKDGQTFTVGFDDPEGKPLPPYGGFGMELAFENLLVNACEQAKVAYHDVVRWATTSHTNEEVLHDLQPHFTALFKAQVPSVSILHGVPVRYLQQRVS